MLHIDVATSSTAATVSIPISGRWNIHLPSNTSPSPTTNVHPPTRTTIDVHMPTSAWRRKRDVHLPSSPSRGRRRNIHSKPWIRGGYVDVPAAWPWRRRRRRGRGCCRSVSCRCRFGLWHGNDAHESNEEVGEDDEDNDVEDYDQCYGVIGLDHRREAFAVGLSDLRCSLGSLFDSFGMSGSAAYERPRMCAAGGDRERWSWTVSIGGSPTQAML
jgi:hypothetical protein